MSQLLATFGFTFINSSGCWVMLNMNGEVPQVFVEVFNQVQLRPLVDWDSIDNDAIGLSGNALCNPFLCHFEV